MKILRTMEMLHPILQECVSKIQKEVIIKHNMPMRLFETGRMHDRHQILLQRGKTRDMLSKHLYNLENDPPLYASAVDFVYYADKWSWNLRDSSITAWYILFGNKVLDICPELKWGCMNRKSTNYCHFELRRAVMVDNLDKYPCVTP